MARSYKMPHWAASPINQSKPEWKDLKTVKLGTPDPTAQFEAEAARLDSLEFRIDRLEAEIRRTKAAALPKSKASRIWMRGIIDV